MYEAAVVTRNVNFPFANSVFINITNSKYDKDTQILIYRSIKVTD